MLATSFLNIAPIQQVYAKQSVAKSKNYFAEQFNKGEEWISSTENF